MKTSNLRTALITACIGAALLSFLNTGCRTERRTDGTAGGTGRTGGAAWSAITLPAIDIAADSLKIYPDYTACRLPRNIAPCNFRILTPHTRYRLTLSRGGERLYTHRGRGVVQWPERHWQQWRSAYAGDTLWVALSLEQDGVWRKMPPFPLYIDTSAIAPYLTYRLIEPSYQLCNLLTIEERCLENFKTRNLYDNLMNDFNCVNCHTSAWGDPDYSVYHTRFERPGTFVAVDGQLRRVDLLSNRFPQGGAYPAWHPGKRHIAFATAKAFPFVHSKDIVRRTEVYDSLGDIMIYDIYRNRILSDARICTEEKEETFPAFSPDGRRLFFCQSLTPPKDSAEEDPVDYSRKIKYSLVSIEFDAETGTFGHMDTLVDAAESGGTVSFPRVSPDGRFLVFCLSDHGTFPIRHPESDLYLLDLTASGHGPYRRASAADAALASTRVYRPLSAANSDKTESYHEFSPAASASATGAGATEAADGRWLMFSSKRDDGMYSRPYFCLIDANGAASKPFMLPQKHPDFYLTCLKSFNVPVFSLAPAPYDAFTTTQACTQEIIYPESMEIAGE